MFKHTCLLAAMLLAFSSSVYSQNTAAWREKVAPELRAALDRGETVDLLVTLDARPDLSGARALRGKSAKAHYVYNTLRATAEASQAPLLPILARHKAFANSLWLVNAVAVENAGATLVRELAEQPGVRYLAPDPWIQLDGPVEQAAAAATDRGAIEWGVQRINAPAVWAQGFTGQGITIGGADTGYDWLHPALQPHYRGWDNFSGTANHTYNWYDAIHEASPLNGDTLNPCGFNSPKPCDDGSHGTHTMGTMTGDDGMGNQIGVAPGARWIGCRNMERGWGRPSTYLECFQWFLAPTDPGGENADPDKAPHVINNSWYCATFEGCTDITVDELLRQAVAALKASGVVVVVSNGNFGPGCATTGAPPAYFNESFSVGATRSDDTIAGFSSRGPVLVDNSFRVKPNVSAPGQSVRSCIPNGNYATFSGTSMAGPHVAGLVALVLSARPDLAGEVELIETIIEETALPLFDPKDCTDDGGLALPNNTHGHGRVHALAAVEAALGVLAGPEAPAATPVRVFPNPTADLLYLELTAPAGPLTLEVLDLQGRAVLRQQRTAAGGREVLTAPLTSLPAGAYVARVLTSDGVWQAVKVGKN